MIKFISEYGFCTNLINNLKQLDEEKNKYKDVYLYKALLHNEIEMNKLIIDNIHLYNNETLDNDSLLVFPSHGHTLDDEKRFKKNNIIDLLCPLIKNQYRKIEELKKDHIIFYCGDKNHQETLSTLSYFPFIKYVNYPFSINEYLEYKDKKIAVVFQSTYDYLKYNKAIAFFNELSKSVTYILACPLYMNRLKNAINELKNIDYLNSYVFVLGSLTSSNCNSIFNTIKYFYEDIKGSIVNDINGLKNYNDLKNKNIYLVSSTSISKEQVIKIYDYLKQLN